MSLAYWDTWDSWDMSEPNHQLYALENVREAVCFSSPIMFETKNFWMNWNDLPSDDDVSGHDNWNYPQMGQNASKWSKCSGE